MIDPRFHQNKGPFTLGELAKIAEAELLNPADASYEVTDVAALGVATAHQISFFHNLRYRDEFTQSQAGACIIHPSAQDIAPAGMRLILSPLPYRSYGLVASAFYPDQSSSAPSISPTALVDPTATIGAHVTIEPGAVIGPGVSLGDRVTIGANAVIQRGVQIGEDCIIGPGCVLSHTLIGNRVVLYPGVKLGQPGFGFFMDRQGHVKIPQLGRVVIHDDVEIGANTTVDRGATGDTVIGRGTMIDNLVQIGHNVHIGKGCVIVAQVGIAGSTRLGNNVVLGGQVGIAGHLTIGNNVKLAAQSGVVRDVPDHATLAGTPAVPATQWHRQTVTLSRLVQSKGKA